MNSFGYATIDCYEPVTAGSYRTIEYRFTANHPIDDTGYVKIVFRYAGDFGTPQFDSPDQINYCSVSTNGDCRIEPRWDAKGHTRPWGKALYLKVMGGYLNTGESITVVFGDTQHGSPGWRMQTFCESSFEFKTWVDPFATYQFKELSESPVLCIAAGEPVKAVCIAPSQVQAGQAYPAYLRIEDIWGNAIGGAEQFEKRAPAEKGMITVSVSDPGTGLSAESNPIMVVADKPAYSQWWADFHGQSEETIGSNTIDEYFSYARDCAKLDIAAHQGNDFQVTDSFWNQINETTASYYEPDKFVTFPGYEWSGNTPLGGDRNVYYLEEGGEIFRSSHDLLPQERSVFEPSPTAEGLFQRLKPSEAFVFAHVGGRYADLAMHKDDVEVAVEVHSAWGTFEWLVQDALDRNYKVGICANSDGHKGRPGASYPGANKFGSYGGLTCILAPTLDRNSVFTALHRRHFFATTGHRPLFAVTVTDTNDTVVMGDRIRRSRADLNLHVDYYGTAPVEYVEIYRGSEVVETIYPYLKSELGKRIKILWSGAERRGRDRMVKWDGSLRVYGDNSIKSVLPVNFWNIDNVPEKKSGNQVTWKSITTGGVCGLILDMEATGSGILEIDTIQISHTMDIADIEMEPTILSAGGLEKKLSVQRLVKKSGTVRRMGIVRKIEPSGKSCDPLFVKVVQEDGHMCWSSPVYIENM